jgi:hypothetical protein
MDCGSNGQDKGGLSLHHIKGRESNVALNGIVLCNDCHSKCGHSEKEEKKYLNKTLNYLINQYYKPTEEDWTFIRKHHKLYADNKS